MDAGMRAVRQHNCAACHMITPGTVSFTGEGGHHFTVPGEIQVLGDSPAPPVHGTLEDLQAAIQFYEEDYDEEVEELVVRLWDTVPEVGMAFGNAFIEPDALTDVTAPEGGDFVRTVVDYYLNGIEMFDSESDDPDDRAQRPAIEIVDLGGASARRSRSTTTPTGSAWWT